jgi:hypothetical protein
MEMLASLCCPPVLEQRGKEFYRIAQLLSLNAQLVPAASIELRHTRTQPTEPYAHLMHTFGIAVDEGR